MNIAFVDSPLQALNVIEYLNSSYSDNNQCYFIVFKNSVVSNSNIKQIEFVLDFFLYRNILILNINGGFKELIKKRKDIKYLANKLSKYSIQNCLLGEYRSLAAKALINRIKPEKLIVVDDGNATLRINRLLLQSNLSVKFKQILAYLFGLKIATMDNITFFSVYDINHKIAKSDYLLFNGYDFLKNKMSQYPNSKKEFIIGSPLQAAGVVEDDLPLTFRLIDNVLRNRRKQKSELLYISHRRESKCKLAEITKYGIEVVSLAYPFELYALINNENTTRINGFYSSLFYNLLSLTSGVLVTAYKLTLSVVQPEYQEFVKNVYDNYQKLNDPRLQLKSLTNNE